ncbi:MAG: response regulator, partial [Planctomycetota bacterium]
MSRPKRALVIDDDPSLLDLVRYELEKEGFEVRAAKSAEEGLDLLSELTPELVVLDLHLPGLSGLEFLKSCQKNFPNLPVIVLTAEERVDEVVQCMRLGAFDYVQKPFEPTRLLTSVRNAYGHCDLRRKLECVTDELRRDQGFAALLGHSPQLVETIALLRRAAESDVSVLLTGEGGTGKQIAARALHAESPRR